MNRMFATLVGVLSVLSMGTDRLQAFSAESKTVTTNNGTAASSALATRLFLDAGTTPAPIGTTLWFVADKNGDGVPTSPSAGAVLGADDEIIYRDTVDGDQPGSTAGRYRRLDIAVPDSLRNAVIYLYLWNGSGTTFVPVDGSTFGTFRFGVVPPPDVGNAPWLVDANVNASQFRVGGTVANRPPAFAPVSGQVATNGLEFVLSVSAVDPDPGQSVTYALGTGSPTGATIGSSTGEIRWIPGAADVGSRILRVVATDSGTPAQSATVEIAVEVRDRPTPSAPLVGWTAGTVASLRVQTAAGYIYGIQRRSELLGGVWQDVGDQLAGTGGILEVPLAAVLGDGPTSFFRVVVR